MLCDHGIPGFSSLEALQIAQEVGSRAPFVILSGTIGEEAAVEALQAGARDVVLKANLARLGPVLERELAQAETRRAREYLEDRLRHEALHDPLTGLPNRRLAFDRATQMLSRARRHNSATAALYVDLDGFKQVNDSLGHAAGDELLKLVAARLVGALRDNDTAARLAGDEFLVLIENEPSGLGFETVAERLLGVLRQPYDLVAAPERRLVITASLGVACGVRQTADELFHDADVALYSAKRAGRDRFALFEPAMQAQAHQLLTFNMDLAQATDRSELFLLYQPILDLRTGLMIGVEALLRWRRPDGEVIMPTQIVPAAERSGVIVTIGRWVLQEACRQAADWQSDGQRMGIAVNVSARQLDRDELIEDVDLALTTSGIEPALLTLEITETALMQDADATVKRLDVLRSLGVRVVMDDFGTGYSSLARLSRFPLDALKIDRSFVSGSATSYAAASLVPALVQLARALELTTVAEGIEQPAQLTAMRDAECDLGQGFLLGDPMSASRSVHCSREEAGARGVRPRARAPPAAVMERRRNRCSPPGRSSEGEVLQTRTTSS